VVTPEGRIGEVYSMIRDGKSVRVEVNEVGFQDDLIDELIKVSEPLRIRVDSELQARHVVEYAEERGFEVGFYKGGEVKYIQLTPNDNKIQLFTLNNDHHLTFSDYDQWTGWVSFHAEDDKCGVETPDGVGEFEKPKGQRSEGPGSLNPDCTDDSEDGERSYNQRKPHRQEQDPIPDSQFDNAPDSEGWEDTKTDVTLTDTPLSIQQYNALEADVQRTLYEKKKSKNRPIRN
jgi:hypothetical protein